MVSRRISRDGAERRAALRIDLSERAIAGEHAGDERATRRVEPLARTAGETRRAAEYQARRNECGAGAKSRAFDGTVRSYDADVLSVARQPGAARFRNLQEHWKNFTTDARRSSRA